jgi:hypothetical protein
VRIATATPVMGRRAPTLTAGQLPSPGPICASTRSATTLGRPNGSQAGSRPPILYRGRSTSEVSARSIACDYPWFGPESGSLGIAYRLASPACTVSRSRIARPPISSLVSGWGSFPILLASARLDGKPSYRCESRLGGEARICGPSHLDAGVKQMGNKGQTWGRSRSGSLNRGRVTPVIL